MGSLFSRTISGYGETKKQAAQSLRSKLRFNWQAEIYVENEMENIYYAKNHGKRIYVKFYTNQAYPNGAIKASIKY